MAETHEPTSTDTADAVASPPLAPASAPLCYVVDEDASIRHFLSLVLHGAGIDTMEFPDGTGLRAAVERRVPDLVFLNISLEAADVDRDGHRARQSRVPRQCAVDQHARRGGARSRQEHRPPAQAQHAAGAQEAIRDRRHRHRFCATSISARRRPPPRASTWTKRINNGWIEFWYQPKIDLRKKQLAGAEAYARARHPMHGVALPGAFMPGAEESSIIKAVRDGADKRAQGRADVFQARAQSAPRPSIFRSTPWKKCGSRTSSAAIGRLRRNGRA